MATLVKKKKIRGAEIPTASMADIAFLLLIFFLVTTTIDVDTGIGMTLPPISEEPPPPVNARNILSVLVASDGQILVEDQLTPLNAVKALVVKHLTNNGADPNFAENPDKAVVSMKTTRGTKYGVYINVLDELWLGYNEVWDNEARRRGFASYDAYKDALGDRPNEIRDLVPAQLSIAEPDPTE